MRYIITGGTGLVGKALVELLVREQHEVVVLSRTPEKYATNLPAEVKLVRWDARSAEGWSHYADGAKAIINLAGENLAGESFFPSRWTDERRKRIRQSRLESGAAVIEAVNAVQNKPEVVIQASAVGYYGPQSDEEIDENSPPGTDFLAQICVDWENSSKGVEDAGVRHVSIRTAGIVLSTSEGALPRLLLPFKFYGGGYFGNGQQWYTWIHPADIAAGIYFLANHPEASGPVNMVSPQPMRNKDLAKTIGKVMGRPSWAPVPGFAMRLAFGDVTSVVLTGQKVLPRRLEEFGFQFQFPKAEDALEDVINNEEENSKEPVS